MGSLNTVDSAHTPSLTVMLSSLPSEIILHLGTCLDISSLNALIRTARQFHDLLSSELYKRGALDRSVHVPMTPLVWAVKHHRTTAVQKLLDRGADPCFISNGITAVHKAIDADNTEALRLMLQQNPQSANPNHSDAPLVRAIEQDREAAARLLLDAGAATTGPRDSTVSYLEDAFYVAVAMEREWALRMLLEAPGPEGSVSPRLIGGLLDYAVFGGYHAMLKILFDFSKTLEGTPQRDETGMMHRAALRGTYDAVRYLIGLGADYTAKAGPRDSTVLHEAASQGAIDMITFLLDRGADIEALEHRDYTPLHSAAGSRSPEAVQLLLDRGANLHARCWRGWTALHLAAMRSAVNIPVLVRAGMPAEVRGENQGTPLHFAADVGNSPSIRALIAVGADLNARQWDHSTPLHVLARQYENCSAAAGLLIDSGADLAPVDASGNTPLGIAANGGTTELFELLLDAYKNQGLDYMAPAPSGRIALVDAVTGGYEKIVELLLSHGADPSTLDEYGRTAFDWAAFSPPSRTLLVKHSGNPRATDPAQQASVLRESVLRLAREALEATYRRYRTYYLTRLGRCLMFLDDIPNARTAFGQAVDPKPERGTLVHPTYVCDRCREELTEKGGNHFICRVCPTIGRCPRCMEVYVDEGNGDNMCEGHEFLEVRAVDQEIPGDQALAVEERRRLWLQGLIALYDV